MEKVPEKFPMIGKNAGKVSNDWKKQVNSFQRLEKQGKNFPMIGKSAGKVSNDWKNRKRQDMRS
ncbi:MAG: hypothetical protein PHP44_14860 [Kiritimatiellae bacterium]|nr:hypothetical protein [Kiritimatiellia bacterium]